MSAARVPPPERLPTLTEVLDPARLPGDVERTPAGGAPDLFSLGGPVPVAASCMAPPSSATAQASAEAAPAETAVDEARLVDEVLAQLQRRIDHAFEYRLREAMAPVLAGVIEQAIAGTREVLAETLREVVARVVAQELQRRRDERP